MKLIQTKRKWNNLGRKKEQNTRSEHANTACQHNQQRKRGKMKCSPHRKHWKGKWLITRFQIL